MPLDLGGQGAAALVVGINQYELPGVPHLTGAVNDAVAAVDWLLRIGLPPADIHAHLAPLSQLPGGVLAQGARWTDVRTSIHALSTRAEGSRLFIFLSGHGLLVTDAAPIYLLQDYGVAGDWDSNLGLEHFIRYFLSFRFAEQYLFCDACENAVTPAHLRGPVRPRQPPDASASPRPANGLVALYSTSLGQRSFEADNRGLMMRALLDALDPMALGQIGPNDAAQSAVSYDWRTGERSIDLTRLFEDVVAPAVVEAARPLGPQSPRAVPYGQAHTLPPFARAPTSPLGSVVVQADPPLAAGHLRQIRLLTDAPTWQQRAQGLPFEGVLPPGMEVTVHADLRSGAPAPKSSRLRGVIPENGSPLRLAFEWPRPQPARGGGGGAGDAAFLDYMIPGSRNPQPSEARQYNVRAYDRDGRVLKELPLFYSTAAVQSLLAEAALMSVDIQRHEFGPDISARARHADDAARQIAARLQQVMRQQISAAAYVATSPPGMRVAEAAPNLCVGAPEYRALAGFLPEIAVVLSGAGAPEDRSLRLTHEAPRAAVRLDPGRYRVRVELPWGVWTTTAVVPHDELLDLELPVAVGRPPLRNGLTPGGALAVHFAPSTPAGSLVAVHGDLLVAGFPGARLALDLEGAPRAEPASTLPEAGWDALLAAGRLDWGTPQELLRLISLDKATEAELAILQLGVGYAAQRRGLLDVLDRVLASPHPMIQGSADLWLLSGGRLEPPAADRMPVLAWGFELPGSPEAPWAHLAEHVTAGNVWTLIRPGSRIGA